MTTPKIYTRTGDDGQTGLFAGGRISKDDARLHAYGTIDELNSVIGVALAYGFKSDLTTWLNVIQNELFILGADLATPLDANAAWITRIDADEVTRLESEIDQMETILPPLKNFILPGGSLSAATLHIARTTCRRAERWIVTLSGHEPINSLAQHYTNRLSDWLFVAARYENHVAGSPESTWQAPNR
jgi:cob(I)alamin adenosyltransferase